MTNSIRVEVKSLPQTVKNALKNVGYGRQDIAVEASPTFTHESAYGDGYRAFTVALNLETGETKSMQGSWGGASINYQSQVDSDQNAYTIPVGGAILQGQQGGGRPVSCRLVLNPENVAKLLPSASSDVSERDRNILAVFGGIKSSYRADYLKEYTSAEIDSLVERGFLARNKAGSTSITTAGKNARGNAQVF